jgi:hypothetical protein
MQIDTVSITLQGLTKTETRRIAVSSVAGARYSLRDTKGMRKHLDDLLAQGNPVPMTNPSIYRIGRYLLTQSAEFEVQGPLTGGECEVVAIRDLDERVFITVGSDHCDRELEPLFGDKTKQMCPHPLASTAWYYDEVRDHWDSLQLSSRVTVGKVTIKLQDNYLSTLVDLEYLLQMEKVNSLPRPMALFCGAVALCDSVSTEIDEYKLPPETAEGVGDSFTVRLHDPVLQRSIEHSYKAIVLGDDIEERRYLNRNRTV